MFAVRVFPGTQEVFTRSFLCSSAFIRLDFPTFERPTKTISFRVSRKIFRDSRETDVSNTASVIFITRFYKILPSIIGRKHKRAKLLSEHIFLLRKARLLVKEENIGYTRTIIFIFSYESRYPKKNTWKRRCKLWTDTCFPCISHQ